MQANNLQIVHKLLCKWAKGKHYKCCFEGLSFYKTTSLTTLHFPVSKNSVWVDRHIPTKGFFKNVKSLHILHRVYPEETLLWQCVELNRKIQDKYRLKTLSNHSTYYLFDEGIIRKDLCGNCKLTLIAMDYNNAPYCLYTNVYFTADVPASSEWPPNTTL